MVIRTRIRKVLRMSTNRSIIFVVLCGAIIGTTIFFRSFSSDDILREQLEVEKGASSEENKSGKNVRISGIKNMAATHKVAHHSNANSCAQEERFDLQLVHDAFQDSINTNGSVNMDSYLQAYNELLRFIDMLGKLFHFVSSDVREKINIMEHYRKSVTGENYATVDAMIDYEVNHKITKIKGHPPSGARTLLRLHRALLFLSEFMRRLALMNPHAKVGAETYQAYEETLAHYHSWFVRKAFGVAVYAVPSRQHLLEQMCTTDRSDEEMLALLKSIPAVIQPVYDATQQIYKNSKLLDLP